MKIVFCGGGTAGHVTPNIALIARLRPQCRCFYIGTSGMEKQLLLPLVKNGQLEKFYDISAAKFQRKFAWKNFALPFCLLKSVRQSKVHLKQIAPDVVFSKGGYAALPVVVAAKLMKIPIVVHESDFSLGLANKISAAIATATLTTYPTKKYQCCGAIVRNQILCGDKQKGLKTMRFDGKKPILLVVGGSLGAKALNDAICANPHLAKKFDIFVVCGKGKQLQCNFVHQTEFAVNIADLYAAADVCLTRGGSNALAELTLAQVPFVTVPLENCTRGEQKKNAIWYARHGCCMHISEKNLEEKLPLAIETVYQNRQNIKCKQAKLRYLFGTDRVAETILQCAKKQCPTKSKAWQQE